MQTQTLQPRYKMVYDSGINGWWRVRIWDTLMRSTVKEVKADNPYIACSKGEFEADEMSNRAMQQAVSA